MESAKESAQNLLRMEAEARGSSCAFGDLKRLREFLATEKVTSFGETRNLERCLGFIMLIYVDLYGFLYGFVMALYGSILRFQYLVYSFFLPPKGGLALPTPKVV